MSRQSVSTQAADAAPSQVAGRLLQRKCACGKNTAGGSECGTCERKARRLQRRDDDNRPEPTSVPDSVHEVLRSPGSPLDSSTRSFMESRFGHDFGGVRVHTDARAQESARAVGALAYTVGRDLVFAAGQYAPGTSAHRSLLAHELTHVMQQRGEWDGSHLWLGEADDSHEREAAAAARNVASGQAVLPRVSSAGVPPSRVQRLLSRDEAGAESEGEGMGEESDGIVLTAEEAELFEEVLSNEPELVAAQGAEGFAPRRKRETGRKDGGDESESSDGGKKPKTAKRRRRIRKGHFVGGWLVRLLCGHSGRYFRHYDLLTCLRLRRKHKQKREPRERTDPEEERSTTPPDPSRSVPTTVTPVTPPPSDDVTVPTPSNDPVSPPPATSGGNVPLSPPPQITVPPPVPTFKGRRIPPCESITLQFTVAFRRSSDIFADPNGAASTLGPLANFLRQNPSLRVNIAGNVYNNDPGITQGGGKDAINQKGFWLNNQETTVSGVMLARARSVRSTLINTLRVPNTVWVRTGRVTGSQGLMTTITISNPCP